MPGTGNGIETNQRSFADVLRAAISNIAELVQSEIRLVKAEVREHSVKLKPLVLQGAIGVMLVSFSFLFFLVCALAALSVYLPVWQAALVIAVVLAAAGLPLLLSVRTKFNQYK